MNIADMEKMVQCKTLEAAKLSNELKVMKLNEEINRLIEVIKGQEEAINKLKE